MTPDEMFVRLYYFGASRMHLSIREMELQPFGEMCDYLEISSQERGASRPKEEKDIDDLIPSWI